MLMNVILPVEPFNSIVVIGTVEELMGRIIEVAKPESIFFTEINGSLGAIIVVEVPNASAIPAIAEPCYLNFDADCEFRVAMTPEDLMGADLAILGKK